MGMDYAPMLPSPQFGPRFKFEKEKKPEMPAPSRRRIFKQETLPVCPINLESDECISECERDNDCNEFQICCKSGCSTACIDQDLTEGKTPKKQEEEEEVKVTLACPQVDSNLNCTDVKEMCSDDSDCSFDQKCCQVRCSMRCVGPRPKGNRPENRKNRQRGKENMKSSRFESLYPKNNNIMLSNSRRMFPNNYFNQQGQIFPRFGINYGN